MTGRRQRRYTHLFEIVKNQMSRSSPSVLRVVSVLNFFADHPGEAFTLTDLVKALKLSRATCHGLLSGLVETGYLYRTTDKSYVLGPALLHIGEVAKENFSPLQVAKPEMRSLADEFDGICIAAFRERNDVIVRERAAAASYLGFTTPRGKRLPLLPQFAAPFLFKASAAEVKAWIAGVEPPCSEEHAEQLNNGIEFVKANGFLCAVTVKGEAVADSSDANWLDDIRYNNLPVATIYDLKPEALYNLVFIVAPVLDARGKVAFVIGLQGFAKTCTGEEVRRIGKRVVQVCERISSFMAGPALRA